MYKLKLVRDNGTSEELSFDSYKLALIYKEYHLAFGNWNGSSRWIDESKITVEERKYICDEMSEVRGGEIIRLFRVTEGFQISVEEIVAPSLALDECWAKFRERRLIALERTDWTQLADIAMSQELRKHYRAYRQYLRDLPGMYDDLTVISAKIYDFGEYLNGKR